MIEKNLILDILEEGAMDDWLVVKNSADKTEIGIFDKLPARKFVWQTVTFTFEDNNKYSSGILYHITLISNLQKCINVVRNKTLQLNLPQLLHKYTNEIILTKDSTIVNVNDDNPKQRIFISVFR